MKFFNELADSYFKKGLEVIPLELNSKACKIKDWNHKNFEDSADEYKSHGIGLKLSKDIFCLDIDTLDKDKQKMILNILEDYPTPVSKTGNPLKLPTRFYKVTWQKQKLSTKGGDVELLYNCNGGSYTVIPPTRISTPEYDYSNSWTGISILDFDLDLLPTFPYEAWDKLCNLFDKKTEPNHIGRNNKLKQIVVAAYGKSKNIEEIILEAMDYDDKHNDVQLFTDPKENSGSIDKRKNAARFVSSIIGTVASKEDFKFEDRTKFEIVESISKNDDLKDLKLPPFSGICQEIFEHIYRNSPVKRTRFAVASTLATMATILGNRVHCDGIYTNMYILIAASSGGGKDFPLKFPYEAFKKAGCLDLIGGAPESDSGILTGLDIGPTRLDVFDEASRLFSLMNDQKNTYASKMGDIYASLFTSPGKYFPGKKLKNGHLGACDSPCVSILGAMTIDDFKRHFTQDLMDKGIGGRFLFFADEEYKDVDPQPTRIIPIKIIETIRDVRSAIGGMVNFSGKDKVFQMELQDNVKKNYLDAVNLIRRKAFEKDILSPMSNRAGEYIKKMAIFSAIGNQRTSIGHKDFDWALEWVIAQNDSMEKFLLKNMHSPKFTEIKNAIENFILKCGKEGALRSDILRSSVIQREGIKTKFLSEYIDTLVDSELIFNFKPEGSKKEKFFHSKLIKKIP